MSNPQEHGRTLLPRFGGAAQEGRSPKVVSIAEPESISPLMGGKSKEVDSFNLDSNTQSLPKVARRPSARPSSERLPSGRQNLISSPRMIAQDDVSSRHHSYSQASGESLITQVKAWLHSEKARRAVRKGKSKASAAPSTLAGALESMTKDLGSTSDTKERRPSDASEGAVALESLQQILDKALHLESSRRGSVASRRHSVIKKLRRQSTAGSSDTDDVEAYVPSTDALLDNTKTLSYTGGAADDDDGLRTPGTIAKDKQAWNTFKYEIVRLTHTLGLKRWRRVPMDRSNEIDVERLSGALTNAVYVVSPPKNIPDPKSQDSSPRPAKIIPKLLLRIYGPQAEYLINREAELQILRRLARKRIGPRLLGTFTNGRFEEFLHARTLTPKDLRTPDTSKQIAKRMRELHEGIELLPEERASGAFVWQNWDKWIQRCGQVMSWIDGQMKNIEKQDQLSARAEKWKRMGFVCGVEWPVFFQTVEKYRKWLDDQYGGPQRLKDQLVFAHNDTQYGNILRLVPAGESPLLLPINEHKQLVVIDFEYASANLPGSEFANHFTEWCYNYHDPDRPHSINTSTYPTPEEQDRFIRAYVRHRPLQHSSAVSDSLPATPALHATNTMSSSISTFMLDSRGPPTPSSSSHKDLMAIAADEDEAVETEIKRLRHETLLWRPASSAFWIAWGIVQAKIPGLPESFFETHSEEPSVVNWGKDGDAKHTLSHERLPDMVGSDPLKQEEKQMAKDLEDRRPDPEEGEEDEEFDYLAYANERAMFFWGDMIRLGVVKREELPEGLVRRVRLVDY